MIVAFNGRRVHIGENTTVAVLLESLGYAYTESPWR
jgi:sulfur carrier protein ThiS